MRQIKEDKLVFGFVVAAVKMLRFLKEVAAETPVLYIKIDGTHRWTSSGWDLVLITICYIRCDANKGKSVRTPIPNTLMVTFTECKVAVVCFCIIFKILLRTHFNINTDIIAKSVSQ